MLSLRVHCYADGNAQSVLVLCQCRLELWCWVCLLSIAMCRWWVLIQHSLVWGCALCASSTAQETASRQCDSPHHQKWVRYYLSLFFDIATRIPSFSPSHKIWQEFSVSLNHNLNPKHKTLHWIIPQWHNVPYYAHSPKGKELLGTSNLHPLNTHASATSPRAKTGYVYILSSRMCTKPTSCTLHTHMCTLYVSWTSILRHNAPPPPPPPPPLLLLLLSLSL